MGVYNQFFHKKSIGHGDSTMVDKPLPSGYVKIAIENGHRNSEFSHKKWWFSIVFCMFTRGYEQLSVFEKAQKRINLDRWRIHLGRGLLNILSIISLLWLVFRHGQLLFIDDFPINAKIWYHSARCFRAG